MKHFQRIAEGVDVLPVLMELIRQPELWDERTDRRDAPESPHSAMADIWVRYNDDRPYRERGNLDGFNDAHFPIFYPAWHALPSLQPIVYALAARMKSVMLGGILITRIPPGGVIAPHSDDGWHVHHYNTKLYVVLQSNPKCINRVEDENVAMRTGEVWYFDNTKEHEVVNNGDEDRITLIICMRCEP